MHKYLSNFIKDFLNDLANESLVREDMLSDSYVLSAVILITDESDRDKYEFSKVIMDLFKESFYERLPLNLSIMPELKEHNSNDINYNCYISSPNDSGYKFTVNFTVIYPYLIIRFIC